MVKITKLTDIWKAKQIPEYITENMEQNLLRLCKEHLTEDISDFGMFCYIENESDLDRYAEIGMKEPFDTAEPDTIYFIRNRITKQCCIKNSYITKNGYRIYVFCDYEIIRTRALNHPDNQSSS